MFSCKSLKSFSTRRWACRAEAVTAVQQDYDAILYALEEIMKTTRQNDVRAKTSGSFKQIKKFYFIFCLEMIVPIFKMILKVSECLQSPSMNLLTTYSNVQNLRSALLEMRMRTDGEGSFRDMFENICKICEARNTEISLIKRGKVSKIDEIPNIQYVYSSKEAEMKVSIYNAFLDRLVTKIDARFDQETKNLITTMEHLLHLEVTEKYLNILFKQFGCALIEVKAELKLLKHDSFVPISDTKNELKLHLHQHSLIIG